MDIMGIRRFRRLTELIFLALFLFVGAGNAGDSTPEDADFLKPLQAAENRLLKRHPFIGSLSTTGVRYFGEDPCRILYLHKIDRYLILLRNSSEVLLCDGALNILDRHPTPRSPVAWDLVDNKWLFIGGEHASAIRIYEINPRTLQTRQALNIKEAVSIRDLVFVKPFNTLFVLDAFSRQLIRVALTPDWTDAGSSASAVECFSLGAGPLSIRSVGNSLIINLLMEHVLLVLPLRGGRPDFKNAAKITNTGPFWSVDATVTGDRLIIAAGGVEDRPLNRLGGEFGYVDSFLYLFNLHRDAAGIYQWKDPYRNDPERFQAVNLSEHHIVTAKAIRFQSESSDAIKLWVTGFGGERFAEFRIQGFRPQLYATGFIDPDVTDFVIRSDTGSQTLTTVSPLLDRITVYDLEARRQLKTVIPTHPDPPVRPTKIRIGELLFFTTLLTPSNRTQGELSRFTCETCHFEGTADGRTHFTGREDIHATSKTLRGLANNVPLFSRAGSESLSAMVMAEFDVANQDRKDRFIIRPSRYPWLADFENLPAVLKPLYLRQCFLEFFTVFTHRPNPWRIKHKRLDARSKRGLGIFRQRCEDCHHPVKTTRSASAVSFKNWETWLTEDNRDLVWGAPFLCKTGIRPYPDSTGTRVPSLRRIWDKYPYFTNGSAKNLHNLLTRFRYQGATAWHQYDGAEKDQSGIKTLTPAEIEALEALLKYF
jgi:hypothetical protein